LAPKPWWSVLVAGEVDQFTANLLGGQAKVVRHERANSGLGVLASAFATTVGAGPAVSPAPAVPPWEHVFALRAEPSRQPESPRTSDRNGHKHADDARDRIPVGGDKVPIHRWTPSQKTWTHSTRGAPWPAAHPDPPRREGCPAQWKPRPQGSPGQRRVNGMIEMIRRLVFQQSGVDSCSLIGWVTMSSTGEKGP